MKLAGLAVIPLLLLSACQSLQDEPAGHIDSEPDTSSSEQTALCDGVWEGEVLSVTVVTNSGPHAGPYVLWADENQCFGSHGVEVSLIEMGAPSDRIASLLGGSADIIWLPSDPLLAGVANGGIDFTIVAPHTGYSAERVEEAKQAETFDGVLLMDSIALAAPGYSVSALTDFEGKKFGRQSAVSNVGVEVAFGEAGVDLNTVQWVDIEQTERLNALLRGDLDGAVLAGINAVQALQAGAQFLFYYPAWDRGPGVHNFWVTTQEISLEKTEALQRFRSAMWETYRLLQQEENHGSFHQLVVEKFGGSADDVELLSLPDFFPRPAEPGDIDERMRSVFERGTIDTLLDLSATTLFTLP